MTDDANDVSEMWRDHKAMRSEKPRINCVLDAVGYRYCKT